MQLGSQFFAVLVFVLFLYLRFPIWANVFLGLLSYWMIFEDFMTRRIEKWLLIVLIGSTTFLTFVFVPYFWYRLIPMGAVLLLIGLFIAFKRRGQYVADILVLGSLSMLVFLEDFLFATVFAMTTASLWGTVLIAFKYQKTGRIETRRKRIALPMVPFFAIGVGLTAFIETKIGSLMSFWIQKF